MLDGRRREFITLLGGAAAAWPLEARAQPSGKTRQIGFLSGTSQAETGRRLDAMRTGLRQLGYEEGKNVVIHYRWADGRYDRLASRAAELVKLNVEVLVTHSTPGAQAAKQATSTIPIVAIADDPIAAGLVASLARPGGNLTGVTFFFAEIVNRLPKIARRNTVLSFRSEAREGPGGEPALIHASRRRGSSPAPRHSQYAQPGLMRWPPRPRKTRMRR
jgi:putative ABC transport system substrate-binding protein